MLDLILLPFSLSPCYGGADGVIQSVPRRGCILDLSLMVGLQPVRRKVPISLSLFLKVHD